MPARRMLINCVLTSALVHIGQKRVHTDAHTNTQTQAAHNCLTDQQQNKKNSPTNYPRSTSLRTQERRGHPEALSNKHRTFSHTRGGTLAGL